MVAETNVEVFNLNQEPDMSAIKHLKVFCEKDICFSLFYVEARLRTVVIDGLVD